MEPITTRNGGGDSTSMDEDENSYDALLKVRNTAKFSACSSIGNFILNGNNTKAKHIVEWKW